MNAFFHAVAFLTRIPVPHMAGSSGDWQRMSAYFLAVGFLIGSMLWASAFLAVVLLPPLSASVAIVAFWVMVTGALHLDGWIDLADGLGSNRPRDEIFRIMKDSRVGAMGVIAAILLLLAKVSAVHDILLTGSLGWLFLSPAAARFALMTAIWFWPYISEKGMGAGLEQGLSGWKVFSGFGATLAAAVLTGGLPALTVLLGSYLSGFLLIRHLLKRLGGLTGDCYGALVEWTEASVLLLAVLAGKWLS